MILSALTQNMQEMFMNGSTRTTIDQEQFQIIPQFWDNEHGGLDNSHPVTVFDYNEEKGQNNIETSKSRDKEKGVGIYYIQSFQW